MQQSECPVCGCDSDVLHATVSMRENAECTLFLGIHLLRPLDDHPLGKDSLELSRSRPG